jgi:signal transduction histidine kinase
MSRLRVSFRVASGVGVLALLLLVAAASAAGYLVEAHRQQTDRDNRLAAAAAYVQRGKAHTETRHWQRALTGRLAALGLGASLTLVGPPDGKRLVYNQAAYQGSHKQPAATQPTATYVFLLATGSHGSLRLTLYDLPLDRNRRLLVALASGLTALVAGASLLIWAASRWLVAPLRRLSTQVDAIAGGETIGNRAVSPLREVDNVAAAVAGMATRLAQTAEQDARVDSERRLLVSSIAHDLRTPLFSLRGYLDAIATGIGNPHERLDRARAKASQIDRLVTSLFDYARADIDQRPRLQVTDLAEAVRGATASFELAADERMVELRMTARTSPRVTIDSDGFDRALANVIDNALRYSPQGSAIDITCGEDADGAYVQVTDDGPGIPPELVPRVFEPMVRADSARNGGTARTGLGLTIADRLLRNQGGTIRAANAPGRGATFTLRLRGSSDYSPSGS